MRLSSSALEEIGRILPALYSLRTIPAFFEELIALLRSVIPADEYRWLTGLAATSPEDTAAAAGESPNRLVIALEETSGALVLSLQRARAFSTEERLIARILRPHLSQAYVNAQARPAPPVRMPRPEHATEDLTDRETEVAYWLSRGKTNAEIAIILGPAPRTIEKHVENILRKLRVENRTAAALVLHARLPDPGAGLDTRS